MGTYASYGILVLCICFMQTFEACQLPSPLQSSGWNYTHTSRELTLTFGTSTMSGFENKFRGEEIKNYDCISNTNNVYVFKSQDTFSDIGDPKRVYLCMKMTMVSSNLFYFYLLADIETGYSIIPNPERVYITNSNLSDALPPCDFCRYTTSPPDDDFRILRRSGQSSEDLSVNVSLCLPCDATCTTNVECSYPDTVDHATVVITGNNTGDIITYSCSNGYEEAGGNSTRVCQDDGSWSGSPLSCSSVSCGTPPVVSHTHNVTTGTDYGDTITYTCLSGYNQTFGNLDRTCQADKNWTGSPPVCSPVSCGALPVISHTSNRNTGTVFPESIIYTCLSGYEQTSGNLARICQSYANWSGNTPVCSPVSCGALPVISHTSNNNTGTVYDDTITYTCLSGYEKTSGNLDRTCQGDKTWSDSPPVCSPVSCGALPVISHTSNNNTGTDYDDTITHTCLSGYENTSGNLVRTCQADKTWSGSPPVCSPVSCGALPVISHTSNNNTGTDYHDTITYTCLSGYENTSGNLIRTCQADKSWSGSPLVCSPVSCGALPVISHTSNNNTGTDYDDTITYTCLSGYKNTSGNLVRTCQADKTWSGSPPVCSPASCGSLGAVSHTTNVPTGIYYTNTITYTCVSGYEHTSGTLIRTCQATRNWNGSPPVCNAVLKTTNDEVALIIAGTISGCILLFMVVAACLICRVQRRNKDRALNRKTRSRYT